MTVVIRSWIALELRPKVPKISGTLRGETLLRSTAHMSIHDYMGPHMIIYDNLWYIMKIFISYYCQYCDTVILLTCMTYMITVTAIITDTHVDPWACQVWYRGRERIQTFFPCWSFHIVRRFDRFALRQHAVASMPSWFMPWELANRQSQVQLECSA